MNQFKIADKVSSVSDAHVEAQFWRGKWQWMLNIEGEEVSEWGFAAPRLGTFDDFMEWNEEMFNPLEPSFQHTLLTQGFWFTIAGEFHPVNSIEVALSRTAEQSSRGVFGISITADVNVYCDDEYDANVPMSLECEGHFKQVCIGDTLT